MTSHQRLKGASKYEAIRVEYVNGNASLKDLAAKHGMSEMALGKAATRQKWSEERLKVSSAVRSEAQSRLTFDRAKELAQWNEDDLRVARALRGEVARSIQRMSAGDTKKAIDPNTLRTLAAAAESAQRMARLALGANTESHELSGKDGQPLSAPPTLTDFFRTLSVVQASATDERPN